MNVVVDENGSRRYECLVPGCLKTYRNQNGLKYHIQHSHTNRERELAEMLTKAVKDDPAEKPYPCHVPECGKRYRNSNGLKYHLVHGHPDLGDISNEYPIAKDSEGLFEQ